MQEQKSDSVLTLENRSRLGITAVESVDQFSDRQILLTIAGKRVTIVGENLRILSFSQGGGGFCAEGRIDGIRYGAGKKMGNLFK